MAGLIGAAILAVVAVLAVGLLRNCRASGRTKRAYRRPILLRIGGPAASRRRGSGRPLVMPNLAANWSTHWALLCRGPETNGERQGQGRLPRVRNLAATTAACARRWIPNFVSNAETDFLTVFSPNDVRSAISRFVSPSPIRVSTVFS